MIDSESRCSSGSTLSFRWYGTTQGDDAAAVELVVDRFVALVLNDTFYWEPRHLALTKEELRSLIRRAMRGNATSRQVKVIDRGRKEFLYELVFDTNVVRIDSAGNKSHEELKVRVYHSEPPSRPSVFVGLHLHIKAVVPDDHNLENDLQNKQIDLAIDRYKQGRPTEWGLPELGDGAPSSID